MSTRRPRRRGRSRQRRRPPRPSTAAVIGTAVGGLLAGVLYGLADRLPWWAWVVVVLAALAVGYLLYRRGGRRPTPAAEPNGPATEPPAGPAPGTQ